MPSTMMHLYAGHTLWPGGSDSFFLGCILPDSVDFDREWKDHLHFRDVPPQDRLPSLIAFGKTLSLSRDFDFGVLCHFYLDYLWDNGPQKDHRDSYTGDLWFRDYRKELARAGSRVAQRMPWAEGLWQRLRRPDPEKYSNSLGLPEEAIQDFLEFNFHWHLEKRFPPSQVFTDALVDVFIGSAAEDFRTFYSKTFPEEAKKRGLA